MKYECQASFFRNDRVWGFLDLVAGGQSYLLFSTIKRSQVVSRLLT